MIRITPMTPADLDAVMEIELGSHSEPWSRNSFMEELAQLHSHLFTALVPANFFTLPPSPNGERSEEQSAAKVANADERIGGYICFWLVADEVQILNVAVQKACRSRGIGRALMRSALRKAWEHKARIALLEVRPSNTAALRLYESLGFQSVGLRPNYYEGNKEPAILMELKLDDHWQHHRNIEITSIGF